MAKEQEGNTSVEVTRQGIKITGQQVTVVLMALIFAGLCVMGTFIWNHEVAAKSREDNFAQALKLIGDGQQQANAIHRETNCLIGYNGPQSEKAEFCRRMRTP